MALYVALSFALLLSLINLLLLECSAQYNGSDFVDLRSSDIGLTSSNTNRGTGTPHYTKEPVKVVIDASRALHITSSRFSSLCISSSVFQLKDRMKAFDVR